MARTRLGQADALVEQFLQDWERKVVRCTQLPMTPDQRQVIQTYTDWLVQKYTIEKKYG